MEDIPAKVSELVKEREKLREGKRWAEADEVRKNIEELGYEVKDTEVGSEAKRLIRS